MKGEFRFKQFVLCQEQSAMKVGTDGILLGAWCDCSAAKHILDVGTGTGIIALMVAQRNAEAVVDAVEIDDISSREAQDNFMSSPWKDRLNLSCCDFSDFRGEGRYDLIVSNPPFFLTGQSSPNSRRATARHAGSLPYSLLFFKSKVMLSPHGRIAIIYPSDSKDEVEFYAGEADLWMKRRCAVRSYDGGRIIRYMWEFTPSQVQLEESELTIYSEINHYSEDFRNLTREFYL